MHPRRTRTIARLALIALVAAALTTLTPQAAAPVAADGNEAPGAPLAFRSITAGGSHSCGILPSGAVKCWGLNSTGQLGQDSTATLGDGAGEMAGLAAVNLGVGRTATAVSAGNAHTCALLDNGTVKCWGANSSGQLGQGSTATLGDGAGEMAGLAAVNLGVGRTATAVSAGNAHTCALLDDGTVKCWGLNSSGQLGQGSTANLGDGAGEMAALPAVNLGAGRWATAVTAGLFHTCALLDHGTVKCWGNNSSGQLGQDSTATLGDQAAEMAALPAVNLGAGRTATAVTAGDYHTCARLDNGTVKCWGRNFEGQLGQDSTANLGDGAGEMAALPAVNLGAGRSATAVTAGLFHTCALLDNATVKCWGRSASGQLGQDSTATLGDGAGEMAALPAVNLGAGRSATAVTAGEYHTCARLDNGTVKCWGRNFEGQLGQDSTANLGDEAGEMAALPAVNLGFTFTVALTADETTVVAGATVHLHVKVTNTGNVGLTNVRITDANAPSCQVAPFSLAVGANRTVDCTHVPTAGEAAAGLYQNYASVVSTEVSTPVLSNKVNVTVVAAAPSLSVVKSVDETSVIVGATVHLHVKVTNTGNVALTSVTITDANAPSCQVAPFSLAVGAERTVDCTRVASPQMVAGGYHNTASVVSTEVSTPVVSNQVDVTVVAAAPSLSVVKSVDETSIIVGATVHLHVKVTNTGNVALTRVRITDANARSCEVAAFSLAVGAERTVDCTDVATAAEVAGGYHNTASVRSDQTQTVVSNQVDVTVTPAPTQSLSVVQSVDETTVVVGDTVHLHVSVANTGNVALTNVTITDANAPGCEVAPFSLAAGEDVTVDCEHVATAGDVPTYTNTASVTSAEVSTPVVSNEVDVTVTPVSAPDLSVVVSGDEVFVSPGQVIHSHVVVSNTGNVALHNVTVTDTKVPDCADDGSFDLAVDDFVTIDCSYTTTGNDAGTFEHKASVTADEVTTPVVSNQVDVTVDDAITVVMTADRDTVAVGSPVAFTVKVKNTSTLVLATPTVVDEAVPDCVPAPVDETLPPGEEHSVTCTFVPTVDDIGTFSNTATADSSEIVAVESNQVDVTVTAGRAPAPRLATGQSHSCAIAVDGSVRCWGSGANGRLGYGNTTDIGDNETPGSAGPVNLGAGRTATALTAGRLHTCAILDDGSVRCWGYGANGQLGYGNTDSIGDNETPASAGPVDLGAGRTAVLIAAGDFSTCAVLDDGAVRCWGANGAWLGQGNNLAIGDDETPGSVAPVDIGAGRTAVSIAGGRGHTCVVLDNATVRCWGNAGGGQLGYGNITLIGDNETPGSVGPVSLGAGRTATQVTAGDAHTCAVLDNATVRCWGSAGSGGLGYGNTTSIGDTETPGSVGPVDVGAGRTAVGVTAGAGHTCALLDDATVRCWGSAAGGQLGYANTNNIGDNETPGSVGPVDLGAGRTAVSVASGSKSSHTCAILDDGAVRCWGVGANGQLGYANAATIGDDETPGSVGPVDFTPVPALSVVKTVDETEVVAGDTVHLHVKVKNTGNVALTGVTIDDANGPDCEAAPFDLAIGDELTVDCEYVATAGDVPTYTNTASVTSAEVTAPVVSNEVEVAVTAAAPGLSVVVSADEASVSPGQVAHFHVVVSNTGNVALHNVTVTDTMVPDCANDGSFDLAVGAFVTIDCQRTMTGNDAGTFEHKASVTADEVSTPVVSNQVDVTVDDAITVVMTADRSTVAVGSPVVFTIKVKNTSTLQLMTPSVVDEAVPDCVHAPVGAFMQPGQEHTVTCTFVPTAADIGTFSNTATADSSQIVAVTSNQVDVTVEAAAPALTVDTTADESSVAAGENVHLHVTVTNTGNVTLHDVTIAAPGTDCDTGPFTLGTEDTPPVHGHPVPIDRTVDCTHVATEADVPTYATAVSATATELTAAVTSTPVNVSVTIPSGSAHVSGTVTESGSGAPIAVAVAVLLSPADFSPVAVATADPSGHFGALAAPGSYFVYVLDPADGHAAGFHGAPSQVTAVADTTTNADTSLVSTQGTISGAVAADGGGDPLAGVMAMSVDLDNGRPGAGDLTDADGAYTIPDLAPGPRLMEFVDLTGGHRPEFYDDAATPAGSSIISVVGANVTTADAALAAQAVPSGGSHLVGEITSSTGGDLEGVAVMAVRTSDFSTAAGDLTDASGHYDIDLDAGDYKLAFYDPTGAHGFEWFDDQGPDGLGAATIVTATAGTPLTTDAALTPTTGTATGTVTDTGSGDPLGNVAVFAIDATGSVVGVTQTALDGTYSLPGLPPGAHRVRFIDLAGTHTSEYYDNSPDYAGGTPVTITAGTTTPGVDAALTPAG